MVPVSVTPCPVCMILSSLGGLKALLVPQGFVLSQVALGKRPHTQQGRAFLISTSPCASLGNVRFHEMQDPLLGYYKTSYIRLNHYNPCPSPHLALGLGRHQDIGVLTIHEEDVGGLEVKWKTDGEWVRVKSTPDAYIINIGDTTQVWINDENKSVEHRVAVHSEGERFSIAFFLHASSYTMVEPLEELTSEQNPAKNRAYSWGKFITHRKRSNFQKLSVENVQISHFRISK